MEVSDILRIYGEAWVEQDTDKILSIFCKEGTYQERAFEKPFKGHAQIASYWKKKVCEEESDISFKLLNYYTFGIVVVAEWEPLLGLKMNAFISRKLRL